MTRDETPHDGMTHDGETHDGEARDGIAIVGMSGRFPGAHDVDAFWKNIKDGIESITHFDPADLDIPVEPPHAGDASSGFVCAKGMLDDIDMFDARFFGYLPREAEQMDPQHRIFLELCWEAIEHAGHDPHRYPGAIGVYGGCYMDTYLMWNLCSDPKFLARFIDSIQVGSLQTELGNDKDYLATRVAFKLGLRGPAMTLQTACSTSLVSIATACQSLAAYQCDMALAGGVTIVLPQKKGYFYKEGGMLSPDGHCRTFDEHAAGTVFSNGAAVVLLKRVEDAITDGDTIYAVIRGYATNNDGGGKVSYTAPSVEGQAEVISLALGVADIDARTIGYVEAHGTATPMGDPIEVAGLTAAYRADSDDTGYCAIGSVKANLGHLDVASGAIGVIKTALSIHEDVLPPLINFTRPNPKIDFANSPFYVNTRLKAWPSTGWPRRAGVSSFGVGGTNAHVVLEQAPQPLPTSRGRSHSLLVLSARSEAALDEQSQRLAAHLQAHPDICLQDVAHTLQVGRREFEHRRSVVASAVDAAVGKLRAPGETGKPQASHPRMVFMFPGQGAQYPGMARALHACEPVFRDVIDQCCRALETPAHSERNPRSLLLWDPAESSLDAVAAAAALAQTQLAQPAIFALEMALARLLESWGVRANAVIGHSIGELAGACLAGVFSLEDAMRLAAERGRLMQAQPAGRMLAVRADAGQVEGLLTEGITIAAINAPGLTVVSGPADRVALLAATLAERELHSSALLTSHAFHSSMMAAARQPLVDAVAALPRAPAGLEIFSTSLGGAAGAEALCDPQYWGEQLMNPVRFAAAVGAAVQDEHCILLEVGPGRTLANLARQCLANAPAGEPNAGPVMSCLGPAQSPGCDLEHLLSAVGRTWMGGLTPDWDGMRTGARRRVALPTYPFERKRFWAQPAPLGAGSAVRGEAGHVAAGATTKADADRPDSATNADLTSAAASGGRTGAAPATASPDGVAPADVERLIQQQLELISEQIRLLGTADDGRQ